MGRVTFSANRQHRHRDTSLSGARLLFSLSCLTESTLLSRSRRRQAWYLAHRGAQRKAGQGLRPATPRGRVSDRGSRGRSVAGPPGLVLPAPSDPSPAASIISKEVSPARPGDQNHFPHGCAACDHAPQSRTQRGLTPAPRPVTPPRPRPRAVNQGPRGPASLTRHGFRAGPSSVARCLPAAQGAGAGME